MVLRILLTVAGVDDMASRRHEGTLLVLLVLLVLRTVRTLQ